jgi:hypothetical protein
MSEELTQANVSKSFRGRIRGSEARRHPDYIYRVAEEPSWTKSPWLEDRIIYPEGRLPRPELPYLKTVELADYLIQVGKMDATGTQTIEVFLTPNPLASATAPQLVFRVHCSACERMEESALLDWVLGETFKRMLREEGGQQ